MIEISHLQLSFQQKIILEDFSVSIANGENVCLSGPSGRGKSSILKIIQGYIIPQKGETKIGGLILNSQNIKAIRSKIAYVPQNTHLPVQNGDELLHMLHKATQKDKAKYYLEKLALEKDMLVRPFEQMSGGQKQRVVIAVCMSLEREILLLDEPTAALDDEANLALTTCVQNLKNCTVVSASHNISWMNAAGRIINL